MIPQAYINEWRATVPWRTDAQIEQDLVVSRALVEIFSEPLLVESLAFRGGTALHKLFIQPPARYSEDIDLVQIGSGAIGPIMEALRKKLNPWLGTPQWKLKKGLAVLVYRFNSEAYPVISMRLKIEINTREHFAVLGLIQKPYEVKSLWFTDKAVITTYMLEELLGTKLRALYQRKKGRDLFDIATALKQYAELNVSNLIACFSHYLGFAFIKVARAEFTKNLAEKLNDVAFLEDIYPLLPKAISSVYDPSAAGEYVQKKIISCLND